MKVGQQVARASDVLACSSGPLREMTSLALSMEQSELVETMDARLPRSETGEGRYAMPGMFGLCG